jgi:surfeit locus 1 family protein
MSDPATDTPRELGLRFWSFIVFMGLLTVLFVGLGIWQLVRLGEKEALIAKVTAQLTQPPYDLPPSSDWSTLDPSVFQFHPVTTAGHYLPGKTVLVFTSLSEPKGRASGPGYWLMNAFAPDSGGTAFVNRGFVPQDGTPAWLDDARLPQGEQTITGVALTPETAGAFTPGGDRIKHIDWVRDPARLAKLAGIDGPVLPLTIDLPAGPAGILPQGGETTIEFPNNHLGYAFTWFGFALITPMLLAAWIWRQVRPATP